MILVGLMAYLIATLKVATIYTLVLYAWSGLGSSFGPLVLFSLYYKKLNRIGAWSGVLSGGIVSALWPLVNTLLPLEVPPMIPGFVISSLSILLFSNLVNPLPKGNLGET